MQVEIFKRKSPRLFMVVAFAMVIINEGLYVYDLYTDVVVVQVQSSVPSTVTTHNVIVLLKLANVCPPFQFFYRNGYYVATALSLTFIVNHYIIISAMLTYWMRDYLMSFILSEEESASLLERKQRPGDST